MRVYTRQGDEGTTRLLTGERVSKDDFRLEVEGCLDELLAALGVTASLTEAADLQELLKALQQKLLGVGAVLAGASGPNAPAAPTGEEIAQLEAVIDRWEAELPRRRFLLLPGGTALAAQFHVARTVCRRLERRVVTLAKQQAVASTLLPFLNRLGDLLFVAARIANHRAGVKEVPWNAASSPSRQREHGPGNRR